MLKVNQAISRLLPIALLGLAALAQSAAMAGQGPGDLLVAPTRLVLSDKQRTGELLLMNAGTTTATYRITFTHLRMNENGAMQEVSEPAPGEAYCDDIVRFTPRQVTLEPRASQTVRLQLRLPADLAVGEYRSHLQFKAIPQDSPGGAEQPAPPSDVTVRLIATFGVSIPIIVRHGHTSATVTMTDLSLIKDATPEKPLILSAALNRTGNQSVYGDLVATFSSGSGRPVTIATVGGVAVYTPNPKRVVKLTLKPPKGVNIRAGRITLTYQEKPADGGKVMAMGTLDVP